MRVLVLGAGVVGVTSAYYLAKAGHEVEVLERAHGAGEETSYANAGQLSFGYSSPWAAPDVPFKAIKWLFQQHAPLAIKPTKDLQQYRWMAQLLRNCTAGRYAINKERMLRIADYSRECIDELRQSTGIFYEGRQCGLVQLLRTQRQLDNELRDTKILDQLGIPYEVLDGERVLRYEPALANAKVDIQGGLYFPEDQTGDCHLFTQRLMALAQSLGVRFHFNQPIWRFERKSGVQVDGVWVDGALKQADAYVLALGSYSPILAKSIGLHLPVYPLKGYSITADIVDEVGAPTSTVLDETYKIAITRFDHRIRVGGMAEIMGYDLSLNPKRHDTLAMVAEQLFPRGADYRATQLWAGLRPATPDGTPLIGRSAVKNVFLNTGHGTLGWTMACGSGQLLADIISGQPSAISLEGLGWPR